MFPAPACLLVFWEIKYIAFFIIMRKSCVLATTGNPFHTYLNISANVNLSSNFSCVFLARKLFPCVTVVHTSYMRVNDILGIYSQVANVPIFVIFWTKGQWISLFCLVIEIWIKLLNLGWCLFKRAWDGVHRGEYSRRMEMC